MRRKAELKLLLLDFNWKSSSTHSCWWRQAQRPTNALVPATAIRDRALIKRTKSHVRASRSIHFCWCTMCGVYQDSSGRYSCLPTFFDAGRPSHLCCRICEVENSKLALLISQIIRVWDPNEHRTRYGVLFLVKCGASTSVCVCWQGQIRKYATLITRTHLGPSSLMF